jgi:hypothetical protein
MPRVASHGDDQAQVVEAFAAIHLPAEQVGRLDVDAGIAAGDLFPACQHFLDDEAEGQRGHAQVDALDAQRRQAHHDAHRRRQAARRRAAPAGTARPLVSTACV